MVLYLVSQLASSQNVHAVNSPAQSIAVNANGPLVISDIKIDNSETRISLRTNILLDFECKGQGGYPNAKSNGKPAGNWQSLSDGKT